MRVGVLGAGYAGLTVASRLERTLPDATELVVVDESRDHLVQHELHRLIRHPELADIITVAVDDILSDATIEQATVRDVETETAVVTLESGEQLEFDVLAVCLGAETEFYGLDGVETYATPLKRVDHATAIREDALDAAGGDAVVGGGGLSGIQTAGELAELSEAEGLDLDVRVVEMADQLAPGFDETFAAAIRRELEARDVGIETGVAVESADESVVHLEDGRSLAADVFVWTGGIRGPAAVGGERLRTAGDLRVSERTFVVGDAGAVTDDAGTAVPASAQTAVREAGVAAANIRKVVEGQESEGVEITVGDEEHDSGEASAADSLDRYSYTSPGWVVSVGDGAVATVGPVVFSGDPAKATKAGIGAGHLGSVGAITNASKLVAEELGWPTTDGLGIADYLERKSAGRLGTDPATPTEMSAPFIRVIDGLSGVLAAGETIDLTPVTEQADPDHPGSAMNTLRRMLFEPTTSPPESDESEVVDIAIEDESDGEEGSSDDSDAAES